ncbi:MAG: PIN domain-containing protein [Candidatus Aminicenantes bacterium]|nr:PIN domain-containing protein [Candidatus Aminicenantes bacterium]NIM78933.1 PIN domain-containing protein [Candidatus Aminicenantes bacterium]NIN18193.1 PIN domain-containing protein [Candidatus Aminicenantes bacterium]NIN42092.1 PIN domain-containing protein [Candidatus Aminicenantes bacterium]NIN84845.1 PIN domain-containing protein [Candidatus Aminicenantes bacterium]
MNDYVLDTSALLAYIENEEGAEEVETLLVNALEDTNTIYISTVTAIEILYISIKEQGNAVAEDRLKLIEDLPLFQEPLSKELIRIVGEIKASKAMSFADACIAGLAKFRNAVLVHKDPEFEQIEEEVKQFKLKYKKNR